MEEARQDGYSAQRAKAREELTCAIEGYDGLLLKNTMIPYLEDVTSFAQVPGSSKIVPSLEDYIPNEISFRQARERVPNSFSLHLKICLGKASHTYLKETKLDGGSLPKNEARKLVRAMVNTRDNSITQSRGLTPKQQPFHNFLCEYSKHLSKKVLEFTTEWTKTTAMPYNRSLSIKTANEIRVTVFQQYMKLYIDGEYTRKVG